VILHCLETSAAKVHYVISSLVAPSLTNSAYHCREGCLVLRFAAQFIVAEITSDSSYLTEDHVRQTTTSPHIITTSSLPSPSLSAKWNLLLRPTTDRDATKSKFTKFFATSEYLHEGAKTLQVRISSSYLHLQPS
jgi:hypothetical protein